jgi:PGF-pre-PGF domain-containing protein
VVASPTPTPRPVEDIVDEVEELEDEEAATTVEELEVEEAVEVVERLTVERAVEILERVSVDVVVEVLNGLDLERGAEILNLTSLEKSVEIFEALGEVRAGELVEELSVERSAQILEQVTNTVVARTMERLHADTTASIVVELSVAKAAAVLEQVEAKKAGAAMDLLPAPKTTELVERMSEASLVERLPEMRAESLHAISPEVLFRRLPNAPVEQLVREVAPLRAPGAGEPLSRLITPTEAEFSLERAAPGWAELDAFFVSSPAPVSLMLAKLVREAVGIRLTLTNLFGKPATTPDFADNQVDFAVFAVNISNIEPEDIDVGHLTVFVEKEWLDANDINQWSIQLQRFDEEREEWVPFPTKKVREDEERVYYSIVVPGFSALAVTGGSELPPQEFTVSDLTIAPRTPVEGELVTIGVRVTNTGAKEAVFPREPLDQRHDRDDGGAGSAARGDEGLFVHDYLRRAGCL